MEFIAYPKCSTCIGAKKWLDSNGIKYNMRNIVENNPTKDELARIYKLSGLPLKRLFNTSGMLYRDLSIKDKLKGMSESEMLELLSTNGMLVKRPILVGEDFALIGFKEIQWTDKLL